MLALCFMLWHAYYAQNYAGIIDTGLVLERLFLRVLSIHSSSINLQHEIDSETGGDGLMSSHDKTCQDCFCNAFARSGNASL